MRLVSDAIISEFKKFDTEKVKPELIQPEFLEEMARILTFGASKYGLNNWKKCGDMSRYRNAIMRHILAFHKGEMYDEESLSHLGCIAVNAMFLYYFSKQPKAVDKTNSHLTLMHKYMQIAKTASNLSKDNTKIGALVLRNNRIISVGVNGYPSGHDDSTISYTDKKMRGKIIHAEMNAILNCKQPADTVVIYGLPPCGGCLKFITAYGINRVFYCCNPEVPRLSFHVDNFENHKKYYPDMELIEIKQEDLVNE